MERLEPHVEEDLVDLRVNIFSWGFVVWMSWMHSENIKQYIWNWNNARSIKIVIYVYMIVLYVISMQKLYDGPEDLVEKMKSLSITPECFPAGEHSWCSRWCILLVIRILVVVLFQLLSLSCRLPSFFGEFRQKRICASWSQHRGPQWQPLWANWRLCWGRCKGC